MLWNSLKQYKQQSQLHFWFSLFLFQSALTLCVSNLFLQVALCVQLYSGGASEKTTSDVVLAVHISTQEDVQSLQECVQNKTRVQKGVCWSYEDIGGEQVVWLQPPRKILGRAAVSNRPIGVTLHCRFRRCHPLPTKKITRPEHVLVARPSAAASREGAAGPPPPSGPDPFHPGQTPTPGQDPTNMTWSRDGFWIDFVTLCLSRWVCVSLFVLWFCGKWRPCPWLVQQNVSSEYIAPFVLCLGLWEAADGAEHYAAQKTGGNGSELLFSLLCSSQNIWLFRFTSLSVVWILQCSS